MNNMKSKILCMLSLLLIFDSAAFATDPGVDPDIAATRAARSAEHDAMEHAERFGTIVEQSFCFHIRPFKIINISSYGLTTNRDVRNVILSALGLSEETRTIYNGPGDLSDEAKFESRANLKVSIMELSEEQKKTAMVTLQGNRDANATKSEPLKILSDRLRGDEKESLSAKIKALDNENILDPTRLAEDILALSESLKTGFFVPKVKNLIDLLVTIEPSAAAVTG